ncbi:MAG: hypothetical protein CBC27_00805 [Opitutia bacterium TMED67]|nr:MAG: hypothetical protein CBC27_03370 [Opitutae bacterium TMED67]OUU77304.1 MAG: hypothetical protein CBC27_00805 [Opitutae bacterium TMED67]|tara:strand:- start:71 stop:313 length:243 start_codon:yes stop_codon:yes gene_type:complete
MSNNEKENMGRMYTLQDLLTDEFIARIKIGDAEPSLLNAARQYLKDNGVHSGLKQDTKIQDLVSVLPFKEEEEEPISKVN